MWREGVVLCMFPTTHCTLSHRSTSETIQTYLVVDALSGEVGCTTLRELEDKWCLGVTGSFEGSYDRGRGCDVDCWNSEVLLLCVLEQVLDVVAVDDAALLLEDALCHGCCDSVVIVV